MMKKSRKLVTVLAALAALLLPSGLCTLKVAAAEPVSYHFFYDSEEGEWYVLTEADLQNEEEAEHKVMQFFYNEAKDGDMAVVHNGDSSASLLDLGSITLSNLTMFYECEFSMVQAGTVLDFDALSGSCSSISAVVVNADLYNPCTVNFNADVQDINVHVSNDDDFETTIGSGGTVGCLNVSLPNDDGYTLYNFKKNTLLVEDGELRTEEADYSKEPSAAPQQPAQPSQPAQSSAGNPADEYDEVPKTGEVNYAFWLFCAGALCMALSCGLCLTHSPQE